MPTGWIQLPIPGVQDKHIPGLRGALNWALWHPNHRTGHREELDEAAGLGGNLALNGTREKEKVSLTMSLRA